MNSFLQTINSHDRGALSVEASEEFARLIGLVKERGKSGSITLTLKVKPIDADAESVTLVAAVKVTEPKRVERSSIFFTTEENTLVRDNPKQADLPGIVEVEKNVQPIKPIAATPAPTAVAQ